MRKEEWPAGSLTAVSLSSFIISYSEKMSTDQLFRSYYRPLCLYALHYVADAEVVEDIVQDCFVRYLEQQRKGVGIEEPKSWLYRAARNASIDYIRREKKMVGTMPLPHDLDGFITDEEAQERSLHEAELWTAIDALPPRCREVFLLSKRDNKKYREIALQLGISEKTVEHHVAKALRILRGKRSDYFYLLSFVA